MSRKLFIDDNPVSTFLFFIFTFIDYASLGIAYHRSSFFISLFFLLLILRKSLNNKGLISKHTNKFTFNFDSIITFTKFSICNKLFMLSLYHFILACSCNNSKNQKKKTKKPQNKQWIIYTYRPGNIKSCFSC